MRALNRKARRRGLAAGDASRTEPAKRGSLAALRVLKLLFGFREPVDRRTYIVAGFSLAALKYVIDYAVVRMAGGDTWTPLAYLTPSLLLRESEMGAAAAPWLPYVMVAYTIPFAWIGLTMSVRRAADAGIAKARPSDERSCRRWR